MHLKAKATPPASYDPKSACQFCPIGASNAGAPIDPMAEAVQSLERHCVRCQKPAARRINGKFCVSCYNRDREVRVGRNRWGHPPSEIQATIHTATVTVSTNDGISAVAHRRVAARTEAMALIARGSNQPMYFGIPPLRLEQHL